MRTDIPPELASPENVKSYSATDLGWNAVSVAATVIRTGNWVPVLGSKYLGIVVTSDRTCKITLFNGCNGQRATTGSFSGSTAQTYTVTSPATTYISLMNLFSEEIAISIQNTDASNPAVITASMIVRF